MEDLIQKLEDLENNCFSEYTKINDKQNPEYWLIMGKCAGIGEAVELLKNSTTNKIEYKSPSNN